MCDRCKENEKVCGSTGGANTTTGTVFIGRCSERGWICPVCGRGVSPNVDYCDCHFTWSSAQPPQFTYTTDSK